MKKFLSLALVFVLVLVTLTSCDFLNKLLNKGEETTTTPEETTPPAPTYDIDAAAAFFDNLYKDEYSPKKDEETGELVYPVVQADLTVVAQIVIDELTYTVEWAVDSDKVTVSEAKDGFITIDVNEESKEEVKFTLSATIKDGDGKTATRSYQLIVPIYTLWSHEEYMNAKEGDSVVVKGVVVAMNSTSAGNKRNHLFLADLKTDGGYYSYDMGTTQDPVELGIEVGMIVEVSGPATPYTKDGVTMAEIKGGSARIVDTNKQNVAPIDVTAKFAAGESLVQYVGRTVTIKGVEIGTQEIGGSSDYLWFKLGDKSAYLRTYLTDMPHNLLSKDEKGTPISAAKTTIEAEHLAHFGYSADVTGVVIYYGAQVYLMPLDTNCFVYGQKVEKTAEQKIAEALENLELPALISKDTTLDLPAVSVHFPEVTFTWTVSEGYTITNNQVALKVTNTPVDVKFTVVATCDGKTANKELTVKVALAKMSIADASKLDDGAEVIIVGVVSKVTYNWSDSSKNMSVDITDATGTINAYKLATKVELGDVITVNGAVGSHNGKKQIAAGATAEIMAVSTVADATAAEDGTAVVLKGTVSKVTYNWSDSAGNMSVDITDATGTINSYKLATKVSEGDEIIIIGKVGSHNGKKQIAAGATAIITKAAADQGPVKVTIADAAKLDDGAQVIIVGVVSKVTYNWSDDAGNMSVDITDATGTINAYKLATKVAEGDVITVTGEVGSHNGKKQIAAGATAKIMTVSTVADATAAADDTEVVLKGTVSKVTYNWSDTAGNMSIDITDATGTINSYKLATKVAEGDEIILIGKVGSHNSKKQIAAGAVAIITKAATPSTPDQGGNEEGGNTDTPAADAPAIEGSLATFSFGANGKAEHVDGSDLAEGTTYTSGNYTLTLTGVNKVYTGAFDAKGNSCIKLGTSSVNGTFKFTVADGVNEVVIRVSSYKAKAAKVTVNGTEYSLADYQSNDGEYYDITIDTTTTKTIEFASVSGSNTQRVMVDAIAYFG